jgi:predicted GH43/DUF377 family glycosyl hydrolase
MGITRYSGNPLIEPKDVKPSRPDFKVVCVFNAGVTRFQGDVLLLMRVAEKPISRDPDIVLIPHFSEAAGGIEIKTFDKTLPGLDLRDSRFVIAPGERWLTSISHLRVARSSDGIHFEIEDKPAMAPASVYEAFGIEDPRIMLLDNRYWINYSAISAATGVTTCLASTDDFRTFVRHGVIFTPDNKDIAIFPEKINGKFYALNRPASAEYQMRDMWISESPDLVCWGNHRRLMGSRPGFWDDGRIGCSAVPFRVKEGWLEIYHGASKQDRYCLGAALLDADEPWKVLARSRKPIIEPETAYELNGFFGNVIFNCGVLCEGGIVKIYYGAADTCIAYAEADLSEILDLLEAI